MTTQFDCALDGVALSSLDDTLCVLDIREDAPKMRTAALALRPAGRRLLHQQRESLTVQIGFAIHEEDPVRRREVLQSVHAWAAKGGILTTSERPGQQLTVICTALPAMSAEDWTETLTLAFTTTLVPYWEAAEASSASGSDVLTLTAAGNAGSAPVDVIAINDTDETVTSLKIYCGGTQMVFEGISMPAGGILFLIQSGGVFTAELDGESILPFRTPESDDLLLAPCGTGCTAYASASAPLQAAFTVRGRYA